MKNLALLILMLFTGHALSAQYVYTIKADSVKITNNCDTAELIIENHTQNVLGFLYNKGKGRTEFRKITKLNDSTLIFGDDTMKVLGGGWKLTGNSGTNPAINYIGTNDSIDWVVRTNLKERIRVKASGNVGIGPSASNHFALPSARVVIAQFDTIAVGHIQQRSLFVDRTNVGANNLVVGNNHGSNILSTSYFRPDTNTTYPSDYQSGSILGIFSSGGFLNKAGVPTQTITGATTAQNSIAIDANKFLIQGGDIKNINAFTAGRKYIMEVNSYGTTQHYADIVLGLNIRKVPGGASHVFTNKYGIYMTPVKDGTSVTNGYTIYSEGASDTAYLAGHARIGGNAKITKLGVNINPAGIGTAVFGAQAANSNGAFFRFYNTAGNTRFAMDLVSDDGRFDMFDNNGNAKIRIQGNGVTYFNAANVGINTESPAARLHVSGTGRYDSTLTSAGRRVAVAQTSSNITLNDKQEYVFCDATSGAVSVMLPTASGRDGQRYTIKKTDASGNAITVNTSFGQTIDGAGSYSLSAQWNFVTVVCNGSNWLVVAKN